MMTLTLPGRSVPLLGALSGIGGGGSSIAAPPPPPRSSDPAITAAQNEARLAEKRRKGRAAMILTDGEGTLGEAPVSRPAARSGAVLLGQ